MKVGRKSLAKIVADKARHESAKSEARAVAAYLLTEKRTGELGSLLRDVQAVWADEGYVEVIATSAHELSATAKRDIEDQARALYPEAKHVLVTPQLDPAVIGGVRLEVVAYQLDLTTKAMLNRFKTAALARKDEL